MATKRSHREISDCDEEILTSGKFSDVTVKCGNKTWNLHRAILVPRCPFFQIALEPSKFKESMSRCIELYDQDSQKVNWIIHFIYTAYVPDDLQSLLENNDTVMETCVDLFTVADFFSLDKLCERAVEILSQFMDVNAKYFLRPAHSRVRLAQKQNLSESVANLEIFYSRFFKTVVKVYNMGSDSFQPLKAALIRYPEGTDYDVLREQLFRARFFEDAELTSFAIDVFKKIYSPRTSKN